MALALSGCASWSSDLAPPRPDQPWVPATNAQGEIIAGEAAKERGGGRTDFALPANKLLAQVPETAGIDAARTYGLPELIDIAESNNQLTRVAWNTARNAALAVGIARSSYLPRLTAAVVGGYSQGSNSTTFAPGVSLPFNASNSGNVSALGLQWLLFDFGQRDALVEAASQGAVVANVSFTAAHQQLIYDVTSGFYTHSAARERVKLLEQSLANAKSVQAAAELRMRQGQGNAVELAQARQATAQAELRLVQARGAAENTYLGLLTAIGISPSTRLRVADMSDRRLSPAVVATTEAMIGEAVSRRPDVLAAYATAKAGAAGVDAAKAEFLPKVFATGNVAYAQGGLGLSSLPSLGDMGSPVLNLSNRNFASVIIAGVSVPVYDGGVRSAMLQQAQARADSANATLARTREEAVRQIVRSDNALKTSVAAYTASSALAAAAGTTFDAALAAYRSGVGSVTDATLAQNGLLDARLGMVDSYHASLIAAVTLAFATGSLTSQAP